MKWLKYVKQVFLFNKLLFTLISSISYNKIFKRDSEYLMNTLYNDIMNNGAVVIKFAQWITTRYNIIYNTDKPKWLIKFNNLYENCNIHNINYTAKLFEDILDSTIEDYFKEFNKNPIASGSIGQVYKAITKDNNTVAVKVMHPNIEIMSGVPIFYLKAYNYIFKNITFLRNYSLPFDIDNFFDDIQKQIDFRYEYDNLVKFNNMYKDNNLIIFPKPIFKSKEILITSYEEGTFFEDLDISEYKKYKIVQLMILFVRDSSIIQNFMHADLHQGNWKVRCNDNEYALVIYDVGICIGFEEKTIKDFWFYWETSDRENLSKLFTRCIHYHPPNMTLDEIEDSIYRDISCHADKPTDASNTISETLRYMNDNNIIMNSTWLSLCISVSLLEDFFKKYGIVDDATKIDSEKTKKDVFKIFYLNYISYCNTNNIFPDLKKYLEECLDRANIKFDNLFSNLEHRLNDEDNFKEINLDDEEDENIELSI